MNIRCMTCWTVLTLAAVAAAALPAAAGEGEVVTLPNMGPAKNGLLLRLDTAWVASPGYRPIHIEVTTDTGRAATKDRRLQLEFMPHSNWSRNLRVSGEIVLPQGQTKATGHLLVPQTGQWYSADINIYENGVKLKDLSAQYIQVNRTMNGFNTNSPTMLLIDTDAPTLAARAAAAATIQNLRNSGRPLPASTYDLPDVRGLSQWSPAAGMAGYSGSPVDDATLLDVVHNTSNLELLPPEQLPDQWIAFSSVDIVFISLPDLLAVRTTHVKLSEALKQWAASGGNLVVFGVGNDYQRLNQIETIVGLSNRTRSNPLERWKPGVSESQRSQQNLDSYFNSEWNAIRQFLVNHPDPAKRLTIDQINELQQQDLLETTTSAAWVPMRVLGYGHGKIVAMPQTDPFPGSYEKWEWLEDSIKPYGNWNSRVGVDLENGDHQFLAYAIPDVGMPPVNTFRLLITLFVIVIGPVNYLLLKRRKRLFLLLVTVPLGAAIVTASLFSYALIKDGLRVRARVHSFTSLDQRAGLASSWSRQTYFASLPPSRGLAYPDSATVHAVFDNNWQTRTAQQQSNRSLQWTDDQQRLLRGYLGSRTTTEFLVANSVPLGEATLEFDQQGPGQPPKVTNKLGVTVNQLLLVADDGKPYWAEAIAPDQSVTPEPHVLVDALDTLRRIAMENQPTDPFYDSGQSFFFGYRQRYSQTPSLAGQGLLGHGRYRSLFIGEGSGTTLEPGEYLALVSSSPYVPLGVQVKKEEASFHMIRGRYVPQ